VERYGLGVSSATVRSILAELEAAGLLTHPQEGRLVKLVAKFPHVVRRAAEGRRPHEVAGFVYDIAAQFNLFYRDCPVLPADPPLRAARLGLVDGTRIVLQGGLDCLGLPAPREM